MKRPLLLPVLCLLAASLFNNNGFAQAPANDVNTPLHLMKPDYPVAYGVPVKDSIYAIVNRVYNYLDAVTPAALIDKKTQLPVTDFTRQDTNTIFKPGDFRLMSYEWGVTYSGMLRLALATGEKKFADYTFNRLRFIAALAPFWQKSGAPTAGGPIHGFLHPHALDDGGAISAAMLKAIQADATMRSLTPLAEHFLAYISNGEFRLSDGTLARNRPMPNSLWLDDLYMGVPALAQMGKFTGDKRYFDEAVKQVEAFSKRMFNKEKGLYMHGWIQGMEEHPQFHWGRANGWALLTMCELLDVLPAGHPGRAAILSQFKAHVQGLQRLQASDGYWHQLLDRNDSYTETSATAIYTYCIAHAINQGWLDPAAYGPAAALGWAAVAKRVNNKGQVEGVCVGTGMGFDPAFYCYRPVNVYAAHGYGPVLLAGAEMMLLSNKYVFRINDSALQLYLK